MKFADVTNDIAFRKIFGNENKKVVLISFLNAVITLPGGNKITSVAIANPYQLPNLYSGKSTIVDVKATDEFGNTFIVEMQVAEPDSFHKRVLYYTSQSYTAQINQGVYYNKLNAAYFIGILEFEIGKNPCYISRHKVLDVETGEHIIQDIEFNFIELPKFNKTAEQLETDIDKWVYFIKNAENLTLIPEDVGEGLKEAYIEADKHNWTQRELDDYERASIKEGDEINILKLATRRAEAKGMEKGMEKGIEKGIEIGIEKTTKEKDTAFVLSLLQNTDFGTEKIAVIAGVTKQFVEMIKEAL